MTITRRLQQFIKETAIMAIREPERDSDLTFEDFVKEYTNQIVGDDYVCMVTYADGVGIKVPQALRSVLGQ